MQLKKSKTWFNPRKFISPKKIMKPLSSFDWNYLSVLLSHFAFYCLLVDALVSIISSLGRWLHDPNYEKSQV